MSLEFRIGARVVYVYRGSLRRGYGDEARPVFGIIYTIRAIVPSNEDRICFLLEEIHNEPRPYKGGVAEYSFWASSFRPVRETSIDCFTALLAKPPVRQKENA